MGVLIVRPYELLLESRGLFSGLRAAAFTDGLAVVGTEDAQSSSGEKK